MVFISQVIGSVIRNIGKWSEISVLMIPGLICLFKKALVRMRSIAVAFVKVTLIGLLIRDIKLFWNANYFETVIRLFWNANYKKHVLPQFLYFLFLVRFIQQSATFIFFRTPIPAVVHLSKLEHSPELKKKALCCQHGRYIGIDD